MKNLKCGQVRVWTMGNIGDSYFEEVVNDFFKRHAKATLLDVKVVSASRPSATFSVCIVYAEDTDEH